MMCYDDKEWMLKPPAYTYEDKEQDFSTREDKHRDSGY
jgi:hypothetical protein